MRDPILVTGVARSRTSMVARALDQAGVFGGKTLGPDKNNPWGYFENREIREKVLKPVLASHGADPLGIGPLPKSIRPNIEIGRSVRAIMRREGYQGGSWYYKDAKLALQWRVWSRAFPNATWVIVQRDREEIVESCLRTSFMRQHSDDPNFWRGWVDAYRSCLDDLGTHVEAITIHPPHGLSDLVARLLSKKEKL